MTLPAQAWFLEQPCAPLVWRPLDLAAPLPGEALVEVTACGLCHTDLGYADGSVRPNHALPLVLGHEVVGRVVQAGPGAEDLVGRNVLVPAVLPCGTCDFCLAGRGNACPHQKMPGNDAHGGFSTHLKVPAAPLVVLDGIPDDQLWPLAVVADAVSTAWQAVRRANLQAGDAAMIVGAGGVGGFVAQVAHALGAHVTVCDVSQARLQQASELGADHTVDVTGKQARDVRKTVHAWASGLQVPSLRWKIFECSGSEAGQALAWTLLGRAATVIVVGFSSKPLELRLSNLMAFDATAHGTWGCPPEAYPDVLGLIAAGKVRLDPVVERAPMSRLNDFLSDLAHHRLARRVVLDPLA